MNLSSLLVDFARSVLRGAQQGVGNRRAPGGRTPGTPTGPSPRSRRSRGRSGSGYPGDFTGPLAASYRPTSDGQPDPGEVCWAWIPYEEDDSRGKDRPALIVGQDGPWLLAMPLTSKDHDRDAGQEAAAGRHWMDVGTGPWDRSGRPSEVRLDRIVRLAPTSVRREGSALDRSLFDRVIAAAAALR